MVMLAWHVMMTVLLWLAQLRALGLMLQLHVLHENISTWDLSLFVYTLVYEGFDVHGHGVYLFLFWIYLHKKGCWGFLLYGFPQGKIWRLLCMSIYVMWCDAFTVMSTVYYYTAHIWLMCLILSCVIMIWWIEILKKCAHIITCLWK